MMSNVRINHIINFKLNLLLVKCEDNRVQNHKRKITIQESLAKNDLGRCH